jgi:hypothetical protein
MTAKIYALVCACLAAALLSLPYTEAATQKKTTPKYDVSGHVAGLAAGHRARVVLSSRNKPDRTTTMLADGTWVLHNVPPGSYEVRPSHTLYRFSPSFHTVAVTSRDVIHINFTGWRLEPKKK